MVSLHEILFQASRDGWATGHFNISTLEQMRGICIAAQNLKCPIFIGTSEGERNHIGLFQAVALRDAFRKEFGIPIFLNADHSKSVETARLAIDAGYDSIHIDLSALPYAENVSGTREVVEYAEDKSQSAGHEINVEGELGILKGESKIEKEVIEVKPEDLTTPEEAARFAADTGIDRLAPAVGNIHGIPANAKVIFPDLIRGIREAVSSSVGITLHGASGISDDQIQAAIKAGINNIHINTEIRVATAGAIRKSIAEYPDETTPYKLLASSVDAVRLKVEEKLRLFGSVGRISS